MLYDTHSHPYLAKEKNPEIILDNFFCNGWVYLNSIACDLESSEISIDLAKKYPWVYATIGIHPTHVLDQQDTLENIINTLENFYKENPEFIVAIGEIGLDYHWLEALWEKHNLDRETIIETEKIFFRAQIKLAQRLELPIVIHNRSSASDVLEILKETDYKNFVFHCYSEDMVYAQKLLKFAPDCKLWFGGVVTFKSARNVQEVVKNIPLKNIIIETDSPYLTPTPHRWKQENEPLYTRYVLSHIIDLRDESAEEITKQIFQNSIDFFWVKK